MTAAAPTGRADLRPAIALGGSSNAVSVARSLGRAGVAVHAVGDPTKQVRWSRHVQEFVPIAGPDFQARTLEWLAHGPHGAVLLACDDEAVELIARNRATLRDLGYVPQEFDDAVALAMLDKQRTYELARALGIATPRTTVVEDAGTLAALTDDGLAFPCTLKPLHSHVMARSLPGVKMLVARDQDELRRHFATAASLRVEVMVTETIPGPEDAFCSYFSYLDDRGEPLFHFTRHKLRQHPVGFGLACYATNDPQPDAVELGLRFFQGVGLRGVGNVEFKRDERDGRLKLIECNPRFTAADRHLWLCGLDFPLFVYNRLTGGDLPPMETLRHDVHLWHPLQDVRAFLEQRQRGALTLRGWLGSLAHRQHFPVADIRDPLPTLGYHAALLGRRARRRAGPAQRVDSSIQQPADDRRDHRRSR